MAIGRAPPRPLSPPIDGAVGPLVARLDGIELTEPLLIDTVDCWEWLRADADRVVRRLLMDCWLLNGR